jgi:hypothetical protein
MNLGFDAAAIEKRVAYGDRLRPYRDWFILLGAGALLFLASFALNVWFFLRIASGESLGGNAPQAPSTAFNAAPLQSVDALFTDRAAEAAKYQSQYPFVDPSR